MKLVHKAAAVAVSMALLALLWFFLWLGATVSDTNTKATETHKILTGLVSARDSNLMQRSKANAAGIEDNANRLDELESQ